MICWALSKPKGPKGPRKGRRALLRIPSTEGRSVRLCWATSKPKGPKGLTASHLHCPAGSSRSFTAIRKDAGLYCGPRLRKGEVFAYVRSIQNLKDLKDLCWVGGEQNHPLSVVRDLMISTIRYHYGTFRGRLRVLVCLRARCHLGTPHMPHLRTTL